jgi:hypothetical protein
MKNKFGFAQVTKMRIVKWLQFFATIILLFGSKKVRGLEIPNHAIWFKNFRKRALNSVGNNIYIMFKEFRKSEIHIEKYLGFRDNKNVIVVCVVKNDMERVKIFLEHYRKLEINQFVFLDDKSTDGTKEFLQSQKDVELFTSSQDFFTERKEAWINRILAYYGFNRWYLVVDSDELLIYDDFEKRSLAQFVNLLEKKNITAAIGIMIDMYSKNRSYLGEKVNIYDGIDYFDKIGYFDGRYFRWMPNPVGGMRYRIFGIQIGLGKTPLFFLDNKTIYHIHCLFPFEKNFQKPKSIALLHYKFLLGDIEKYKERIDKKSMFNDSEEYKKYIEKMTDGNLSFYDENVSEKYIDSQSLVKNGLLEKLS